MVHGGQALHRAVGSMCAGPSFGKLSGGNWMVDCDLRWHQPLPSRRRDEFTLPDLVTTLTASGWVSGLASSASATCLPDKIVTWLILPVVICLSQRLSHVSITVQPSTTRTLLTFPQACLSISNLYGETANGSANGPFCSSEEAGLTSCNHTQMWELFGVYPNKSAAVPAVQRLNGIGRA